MSTKRLTRGLIGVFLLLPRLKNSKPNAKIIFLSTISPNRDRYVEGLVNLLPDQPHQWTDERTAYILNHIQYAKSHNIYKYRLY